jgi:NADP-dependent 3-hydroxy acid dehydrogenase YdfG
MAGPLDGTTALDTGASSGIGEATAILYIVTRPWRVAINEVLIGPTEQEN